MNGKRIVFYILAAFISGTILLSYLQYNFSKNIDTLINGNQQYLEEYNISVDLRSLERDIVHVESNISDFVSTGNHNFIVGMDARLSKVQKDLVKVKNNALDSLSGQFVTQLDEVVQLKLSFCKEVLDSLHHKGKYSAETLINTLEGKQLMDSIYSLDQKILSSRHSLITQLNDNNISSGRKVQFSNIVLIVLVLFSAALLFWYIISIIQKLFLSEKKLKNAVAIKENFMANMSHEIRTPMNAILGFTHLLEKEALSLRSKNYVETIKSAGENLLTLINDILDLSKIEAGMMRIEESNFSLVNSLQVISEMFQEKANEKNIDLRVKADPELPSLVSGDPARLLQVLVNLVGNAIKFTDRGFIEVEIKKGMLDANRLETIITVEDSGIGIPKEKISLIFNRFQQGDDSINRHYGGTGLGLSIVKELIQLQNGRIEVESVINKGTKFTIHLPYRLPGPSATINRQDVETMEPIAAGASFKLLIVEDNAINRSLLQNLFTSWGISYLIAENGKQALEIMAQETVNMLLMDLQMPEMDGYTTTREIREKWNKDIPIIAMTAHAFITEKEKCLKAGMNDYISKPIDPKKLFSIIKEYIGSTSEFSNAVAGNDGSPPFQFINLSYLKDISAGNKEFEITIAEDFIATFSPELEAMQRAWNQNNPEQVKRIAHNLKTTISVFGLEPHLLQALDQLELEVLDKIRFATCFAEIKSKEQGIISEVREMLRFLTHSGH